MRVIWSVLFKVSERGLRVLDTLEAPEGLVLRGFLGESLEHAFKSFRFRHPHSGQRVVEGELSTQAPQAPRQLAGSSFPNIQRVTTF